MIRNGVVRDVGLLDVDVTGGSYVGALVGFVSDGEVSDSSVTGSVSGDDYVGGLVGRSGVFFYKRRVPFRHHRQLFHRAGVGT